MSNFILTPAWNTSLPAISKIVLISLADQANDDGVCWPSIESLVKRTGLSESTVFRHLKTLEDDAHIHREPRIGQSTIYHVHPVILTPSQADTLSERHPPLSHSDLPLGTVTPTPVTGDSQNHQEPSLNHQLTIITEPAKKPAKKKTAESEASSTLNREIWDSYSKAYFSKYGTDPVRNATVNGQIAQLGKRLGAEAVHVAGWFPNHRSSWYSQKMHSVGSLLSDCEKLRTEWATNTQMTQAKARDVDRSSGGGNVFLRLMNEGKI